MRRAVLLSALLALGCASTVERVRTAINTGCEVCDVISPLCSGHAQQPQPVTVIVQLPSAATAPSAVPSAR